MDILGTCTLKYPRDGAGTIYVWSNGERTKYRAGGYGYDKTGSALAAWVCGEYQEHLIKLKNRCASTWNKKTGRHRYRGGEESRLHGKLYGSTYDAVENRVSFDGACGVQSLESFVAAAGLRLIHLDGTKDASTWMLARVTVKDTLNGYPLKRRRATV